MSTRAAAVTSRAVLLVVLPAAYRWLLRRWRRAESTCDRLIREAHERADAARALDDAALDAGCDRLWAAMEEHRKENP